MSVGTRKDRRGFAVTMAIVLVMLVTAMLLGLAALMSTEYARTRDAAVEAQLRQLLTAGAQTARAQLNAKGAAATEQPVELPTALAADAATLNIQIAPHSDGTADANISATFTHRHAEQSVHFATGAAGWQIQSAELR